MHIEGESLLSNSLLNLKFFSMASALICLSGCVLFEEASNHNYQHKKVASALYGPEQRPAPHPNREPTQPVSEPLKPVGLRLIGTEQLPIDLSTTIRLASTENLDVAFAKARVEETKGESDAAKLNLLPTLSGHQLYRHTTGTLQGTFGNLESPTFDTVNPEGVFRLSLNPGQAMFEALAAHRNFQATTFAADRVAQNTLLSSIQQYFDLLKAVSGINIAEQAVTESKEFLRVTEIREKQGTVLTVEVFRTQAKLQAEKQALLSAQNEFRQASIRLAITLNLDPKITLFPTDTAVRQLNLVNPSLTLHQLLDIALAKRPEVEESHQRMASATAAKKAAVWNALGPEVALEGAFGGIGKTFGNVDERTSVSGFVGWTLSGSAFGRIKSASARISESQITQEILQNIIESEVIKAYEEILLTQEQIETAKKGLLAAEKSFELSQTNLKLGTGITLEVLQALEAVTDARTRLVEAIVEYNKAQVRLLNALGELSADTIISTLNL